MNAWVAATRPRTLVAAVAPIAVGTAVAYAGGHARPAVALVALLGALFIQIGTNLVNDAADAARGADGPDRLGPPRAVASGLLTGRAVMRGAVVAFTLALGCGVILVAVAGPIIVALGLLSIAAGVAYTAGPYPLAYNGLGELFVIVFFGLVAVGGTAFVQLGHLPPLAVRAAVPVAALATVLLAVNNLRDRVTDGRAGKRTLAVRFGSRFAIMEVRLLLLVAYVVPVALGGWALLPLATVPLALPIATGVAQREGRALNETLAQAARLLLVHSILFAVGIAA